MATADGPRIGRRAQPGESVSPFLTLLRSSDLFLRAEFARSSVLKQATTKGTVRETAVRPLARQLFPRRYEITSGEVMNIAGETSKAQDLIIYEPDLTAGWHVPDTNAVLPAESVLATVRSRAEQRSRRSSELSRILRA